jgi:hypothetical protein
VSGAKKNVALTFANGDFHGMAQKAWAQKNIVGTQAPTM